MGRRAGTRVRIALLLTGALAVYGVVAPGAAYGETTSTGLPCTVVGTDGDDYLVGGSGPDVLCGLGGADLLLGGDGDDTLDGGPGSDSLRGQAGSDTFLGGDGADTVRYDGVPVAVVADLDGVRDDGAPGERDLVTDDRRADHGRGGPRPDHRIGGVERATWARRRRPDRRRRGARRPVRRQRRR